MLMKTPDEILTANLLDMAAKVMLERGRCTVHLHDPFSGSVCLLGALNTAEYGIPEGRWDGQYFNIGPQSLKAIEAMGFESANGELAYEKAYQWNDRLRPCDGNDDLRGIVAGRMTDAAKALRLLA